MGEFFDEIPEKLIVWIVKQQVFWVATAPLKADGHVNVSPKGIEGSFHVVNSRKVWYEDLTGSGSETIAHLRENGRITILFNAFEGPPRICRLFGTGTVHEFGTPEYNQYLPPDARKPGSRSVIVVDVYKVGTSCGYAVPYYDFKGHRSQLLQLSVHLEAADREAESASPAVPPRPGKSLKWLWAEMNKKSLDGLPALLSAHNSTQVFQPVTTAFKKADIRSRTTTSSGGQHSAVNVQLLVGFSLGILMAALYMKLVAAL